MPLTKGSRKALRAMQKRYGKAKGKRVFYAKAMKLGRGRRPHTRANSVYTRGHRQVRRAK